MRSFKTEGIIIKRRNFKEADRILTVMTRDYGKLHIKASGVRKITSRRSGQIELLNHAIFNLYRGKTFLVLTEVKMLDDFSPIKHDFDKIGFAYHLCELIDGLCPEDQENGNVFALLHGTLSRLQHEKTLLAPVPKAQAMLDEYTLGTYGLGVSDAAKFIAQQPQQSELLRRFEMALLVELGYWDSSNPMARNFDTHAMIETILERKLKSRNIFSKLQ